MSKEIKFRAYTPSGMVDIKTLDFNQKWATFDDVIGEQGFSIEEFPLIQYTGLKDKNGKEIYEGDILKVEETMGNNVYNNGTLINSCVWTNEYRHTVEFTPSGLQLVDYFARCKLCEIIGNIYEDSKLLGGD